MTTAVIRPRQLLIGLSGLVSGMLLTLLIR